MKLLILILSWMPAWSGYSCSCGYQTMSVKKILSYDLVFEGEVIEKEKVNGIKTAEEDQSKERSLRPYFKYTFQIKALINGDYKQDQVVIYSATQGASCGVNYSVGDQLYIYSSHHKGAFRTGLCSMNRKVENVNRRYKKIINSYLKAKKTQDWEDEEGNPIGRGKVIDQKAKGDWQFFHKDGSMESEGAFLNGKRHGEWKYYRNKSASKRMLEGLDESQQTKVNNAQNILYRITQYQHGERKKTEYPFRKKTKNE